MKKRALITGITGQDGSYLAELLLKKNYDVHGIVRRVAIQNPEQRMWRINHLIKKIKLHAGTMESYASIFKIFNNVKPHEFYHLAAQSYVDYSFQDEFSTLSSNVSSTHYCLSCIRESNIKTRFYFAGSSEMFGKTVETPQNENTKFYPRSAYGISKVTGFELTRNYREAYNSFATTGILFNHESPRRGFEFVTRKISLAVAKIKNKLQKDLRLGNIRAMRDWGHARDYVEAMWLMLQQNKPADYVIGTGEQHSVEEFLKIAFTHVKLNYQDYIKIDKQFFRPAEVETLLADPSNSKKKLGWEPKTNFEELVREMVDSDLKHIKDNVL
jgi:GDPmannose 4,6-dehydratase